MSKKRILVYGADDNPQGQLSQRLVDFALGDEKTTNPEKASAMIFAAVALGEERLIERYKTREERIAALVNAFENAAQLALRG